MQTDRLVKLARLVVARGNLVPSRRPDYAVRWSYSGIVVSLAHDGDHWAVTVERPGQKKATAYSSHPFVRPLLREGAALDLFSAAYSAMRAADRSRSIRVRVSAA